MPWIRLDDHFDENPKIASVGPLGLALWVTGLAYCNRNLTDGFIPWAIARNLVSWEFMAAEGEAVERIATTTDTGDDSHVSAWTVGSGAIIGLLIEAGLWEHVPGGYRIHDYADFQPTKAQVEAERTQKQAAGQAGGLAAARARAIANGKQEASSSSSKTLAQSKPVPDPVPLGSKEPRHIRAKIVPSLTEDERARLVEKHAPKYGAEFTDRELTFSLSHESALKVKTDSWFVYCDRWMSRQERFGAPSNGSTPDPRTRVDPRSIVQLPQRRPAE